MLISPRERLLAAAAIDYFLERTPAITAIATEFQFANYRRRADVLIATERGSIALEIKSKNDKLDHLEEQLYDYSNYFDWIYAVSESPYTERILNLNLGHAGLLIFDEDSKRFTRKKAAKRTKRDSNRFLNNCLPSVLTRHLQSAPNQKPLPHALRHHINLATSAAQAAELEILTSQLRPAYIEFLKHRGERTHSEDLSILSRRDFNSILG